VEFMGGADAVLEKAQGSFDAGDLRWTATVVSHVVFADPDNAAARELLAKALEGLGYGAENGLWRNIYLRGVEELRGPIAAAPPDTASPQVLGALTIEQLFDSIGIRIDGERAADAEVSIDWVFTDASRTYRTTLSNGAFIHSDAGYGGGDPQLTLTLTKPQLLGLLAGGGLDGIEHTGDPGVLPTLLGLLDTVDHQFAIVTP
jgi:alkyl sulfatase BDS1-like metallo-beta-lactamase superfamily hydrolase